MVQATKLCWKCHKSIESVGPKILFRAVCPHCDSDLHVCKSCRNYAPGKPNDCLVPGTDYVPDREKSNLCEEFVLQTQFSKAPQAQANEASRKLFGEDLPKRKNPLSDHD